MKFRIGHSPDADDAFMFYALANNLIDTGDYEIEHVMVDIESLNRRALDGELEMTAISVHALPYVADKYALTPCGASIGDNYGPVIVAAKPLEEKDLKGKTIAVPGALTTAYLAARLYQPDFQEMLVPFDKIIDIVKAGEADAGLIIHEGQLTYSDEGLHKVVDLGTWWFDKTGGLPLPLGCNVVRKDLGEKVMRESTRIFKKAIEFALSHREEALQYAMKFARGMVNPQQADKFVGMYVNDYTLDFGVKGQKAVNELLSQGFERGIIRQEPTIAFVSI
ncbi:MqnA/MqnD/SBP family protein [Planctomycetota bacterium]